VAAPCLTRFCSWLQADAQLAYLSRAGLVQAVISEDSDCLPYGCENVLFKMDWSGDCQEIKASRLGEATELGLSNWEPEKVCAAPSKSTATSTADNVAVLYAQFLHMCILSGCDYLDSIPGMGIKSAHKYVKQSRGKDQVPAGRWRGGSGGGGNTNASSSSFDRFSDVFDLKDSL